MPKVDFYILPEDNSLSASHYCVRLAEKAFRLGHRLFIRTADAAQTEALSQQLWQRLDSFLAHSTNPAEPGSTITLSHQPQAGDHADVLINLAGTVPPFAAQFQRIAEIVPGNPQARSQSRDNYRSYREKGYSLSTHNL